MKVLNFIIVSCIVTVSLLAKDISVDDLLLDIEKKTDLSQKTQLANSGISFIYTRDDINRMQITKISDILKSIDPMGPVGYNENRYGATDPFYAGTNHPYMSSQIRVYIDNQEMTSGMYGGGLGSLGDMNIEWVDHIEIYTLSPTYEYSTESTSMLIKLYTKSAQKDQGGKVKIGGGSYGTSFINAYYADALEKWSYFAYVSKNKNNRKKYHINATEISRDGDSSLLLATLSNKNNHILLLAKKREQDGFMGPGINVAPTDAQLKADLIHIGYDTKVGNFSYMIGYDYFNIHSSYVYDVTPIQTAPYYGLFPTASNYTNAHTHTFTGELKYQFQVASHSFISGLKYREKRYKFDKAEQNGIDISASPNDMQSIATAYIEDQYHIQDHAIVTVGVDYSEVRNNASPQDDNMFMYRLGYTTTSEHLTTKTIASHMLKSLDSYLINSNTFLASPNSHHKPQSIDAIAQNCIYETDTDKYELIVEYIRMKNTLYPNKEGRLAVYKKNVKMGGVTLRYTYKYRRFDKLFLEAGYKHVTGLPMISHSYKTYMAKIQTLNSFGKFDIFNELFYTRNSAEKVNNYDYSAGIKYNYSKDFIVSIKGTNLFDKAQKTSYYRISPTTFTPMKPLKASPIDQKVIANVEYYF